MKHEYSIQTDMKFETRHCSQYRRRQRNREHIISLNLRYSPSSSTSARVTTVATRSYFRQFLMVTSIGFMTFRTALSFPTGAGGCDGGQPAVGGSHIDSTKTILTGELSEAGIFLYLNGVELDPNVVTDAFPTNTDLIIGILSDDLQGLPYLGFLIRLQVPVTTPPIDTSSSLLPTDGVNNTQTQIANACIEPVVGITHRNNSSKIESTGILNIPENINDVILDVTAVLLNNATFSAYVYSQFNVSFRNSNTSPPSNQPTITVKTTQPSSEPTALPPTRTISPSKIVEPSVAPNRQTPSTEPSILPKKVPTNIVTRSPVRIQTGIPGLKKSRMPSSEPTTINPTSSKF
jgi:hypothetical protein